MIEYNYTSVTANASQLTPANSLGGYISTNSVYTETEISSRVAIDDTTISVTTLPTVTSGLAEIGTEIVSYGAASTTLSNLSRGEVPHSYPYGMPHGLTPAEVARYLAVENLFDPKFDNTYTQYRCIAVKNNGAGIEDVKVVLIQNSTSDVTIDTAIEVPVHDYKTGSLTTVTSTTVVRCSSFAGLFSDNLFEDSLMRVTSGPATGTTSLIESYTDSTGTFVLASSLGAAVVGDSFAIEPAPSQRIINEITAPIDNGRFFGFLSDGGSNELSHNNIRENRNNFRTDDLFYLWIRRSLTADVKSKNNTGCIILLSYSEAGS